MDSYHNYLQGEQEKRNLGEACLPQRQLSHGRLRSCSLKRKLRHSNFFTSIKERSNIISLNLNMDGIGMIHRESLDGHPIKYIIYSDDNSNSSTHNNMRLRKERRHKRASNQPLLQYSSSDQCLRHFTPKKWQSSSLPKRSRTSSIRRCHSYLIYLILVSLQLNGSMAEFSQRIMQGATTSPTVQIAQPSSKPSLQPTVSSVPTSNPTISVYPSILPSLMPSNIPSVEPSNYPSFLPSSHPSLSPSITPSFSPTLSQSPSREPSVGPSVSMVPSNKPSISSNPSITPTSNPSSTPSRIPSLQPSSPPSSHPTISMAPSASPTISTRPSSGPSSAPSSEPTNTDVSQIVVNYYQELTGILRTFNDVERNSFEELIEGYKANITIGTSIERVEMICNVDEAGSVSVPAIERLNLRYRVSFSSKYTIVENYGTNLKDFLNSNLDMMIQQLNEKGIPVTSSGQVYDIEDLTDPPTISPTSQPSSIPSMSPSYFPSNMPSTDPTIEPSVIPSSEPSSKPSSKPSISISAYPSETPSSAPTIDLSSSSTTIIVSVTAAISGFTIILIAGLFAKKRCRKSQEQNSDLVYTVRSAGSAGGGNNSSNVEGSQQRQSIVTGRLSGGGSGISLLNIFRLGNRNADNNDNNNNRRGRNSSRQRRRSGRLPSNDSMISSDSIISTGSSADVAGSDIEYDGTHILADEFEKYKDQNLEKMRAQLEGNVSNFDSMMSQALTMALMDDDDDGGNDSDMIVADRDSDQIEVDVLCEMHDWLKRSPGASVDDR